MPPTGSIFTDWQQVEQEGRLLMDEDFSWSEPPRRRRRPITDEPVRARRRTSVLEYESEPDFAYESIASYEPSAAYDPSAGYESSAAYEPTDAYEPSAGYEPVVAGHPVTEHEGARGWDQPTEAHSHFDEMMEEWNVAHGDRAPERAFDLSDPGTTGSASADGSRRTVVITGRGDERYVPAPRRRASSELRFHERSTFSPDRAGLWAVLLGIALLIGCLAH